MTRVDWGEANEYEAMLYKSVKKRVENAGENPWRAILTLWRVWKLSHMTLKSEGMKERVAYTTQILRFHFDNRIEVDYEYIVNVSI